MEQGKRRWLVATLTTAALLTGFAAQAQETAQVRQTGHGELTYEFLDDGLLGGGLAPGGGSILQRNRSMRLLLIRPRAHFVDCLLKSVENL